MVDLLLDEADQRALRSLLQVEPAPGVPVPTSTVLRTVLALVGGDVIDVTVVDRSGLVVGQVGVPPVDPAGPDHRAVLDELALTWSVGRGYAARLRVARHRRPFDERDAALLDLVGPALERLVRSAAVSDLPDSLTLQERRVLGLVAEGRSNNEIAAVLHVSCSTVRKHLEHAYRKLGVHSRLAAVMVLEEGQNGARSDEFA